MGKQIQPSRRQIMIATTALAGGLRPASGQNPPLQKGAASQAKAATATYVAMSLFTEKFPLSAVATCGELEKRVEYFKAEAKRAKDNPDKVGSEFAKRANGEHAELTKLVRETEKALASLKVDAIAGRVGTLIGIAFAVAGVTVGPTAIALSAAATVLTSSGVMAVQMLYKPTPDQDALLVYYSGKRALMFAQLGAKGATTTAGKALYRATFAAALFVAGFEYFKRENDEKSARVIFARSLNERMRPVNPS